MEKLLNQMRGLLYVVLCLDVFILSLFIYSHMK
jgi:hypothetical protein